MGTAQHNEGMDVEELAMSAGFDGSDVSPQEVKTEPPKVEPKAEEKPVDALPKEEDKPEKTESQIFSERLADLEQRLAKTHDKAFGEIGGLKQKIESAKSASSGLSTKAKERLMAEFPELADILFDGSTHEVDAPQVKQVSSEELEQKFELRLLKRDHPDWETIRTQPEWLQYMATLQPQEQVELNNSWDADFVSKHFTTFKGWKTAQTETQKKTADEKTRKKEELTKRLSAALQPQGVQRSGTEYSDDDEEAAMQKAYSG